MSTRRPCAEYERDPDRGRDAGRSDVRLRFTIRRRTRLGPPVRPRRGIAVRWGATHRTEVGYQSRGDGAVGGAIALGHPLGATGAKLFATLLDELERVHGRYGLLTICEGGGTANATIIERLG